MAICGDRNWRSGLLEVFRIIGVLAHVIFYSENHALAQITPDGTLGDRSSRVTPNVNIKGLPADRIDGGAIRGANLFHSFQEFNVGELQRVYFANPTGIKNILTRVTGGNISNILGTLGVNGGANLFFLNSNGILFGNNARLDVADSFVASTANSFVFGNGLEFSATNPQTPSALLTVNPSALFFNQLPAGRIENRSIAPAGQYPAGFNAFGLRVADGKSLLLVGGNVSMDGGQLNAYGGRVELGGLAAPGNVNLVFNGDNLSLQFPLNVTRASVSLTNQARVYVEAAGGGNIAINARNLEILGGSGLSAGIGQGLGTPEVVAGDITLNATGGIKIAGSGSGIRNFVPLGSKGNGGNIIIDSDDFSLSDGAQLSASTAGKGNGGSISVNASKNVSFNGSFTGIINAVLQNAKGQGGDIRIKSDSLSVTNGAQLIATTFGEGNAGSVIINASKNVSFDGGDDFGFVSGVFNDVNQTGMGRGGDIRISANSLSVTNGAELTSSTYGKGDAGDVIIDVNTVSFKGLRITNERKLSSGVFSNVQQGAEGNGGKIQITTDSLSIADNAELDVGTFGRGNSGNVIIDARGDVYFDNGNIFSSVEKGADGRGGDIRISSKNISFTNSAEIQTGTKGQGDAGNVTITARDRISFDGVGTYAFQTGFSPSGIFSAVSEIAKGRGGDIFLDTRLLSITNGAQLFASTYGQGNAGNIRINAKDAVTISGTSQESGFSSALLTFTNSTSTGIGGDITVNTNIFRLWNGALLSASTANNRNGGDITVNGSIFEALNGGQLATTTSSNGSAGKITLSATDRVIISGSDRNYNDRIAKFPLEFIDNISANSGLFVSSTGSGITGDIEINSPKITLDNQGKLSADSASGNGGNIKVKSDLLLLRHGSKVSTNAGTDQKGGDGGNIDINSRFIVAVPKENSDISANAFTGIGGRVDIKSDGLFGIVPQKSPTEKSDITASSQLGVSGTVTINTPDVDPSRGLIQLPSNLVDASQQIAQGCTPRRGKNASHFIATGRGGLPQSPNEPLRGRAVITGWVDLPPQATPRLTDKLSTASVTKSTNQIVEAQGWIVDANGDIILVAQSGQSSFIPSAISCSQ